MTNDRNSWVLKVISGGPVRQESSPVGWPFWVPVFVATIPFTVLFGAWVTSNVHEPMPLWQWIWVLPVGLTFAMILGLIVQTLWSICVAIREKRFDWFDGLFALLLFLLSAGLGLLYWRAERWFEEVLTFYVLLVLSPMVGFYIHRRERSRRARA